MRTMEGGIWRAFLFELRVRETFFTGGAGQERVLLITSEPTRRMDQGLIRRAWCSGRAR
jgi:hypothetical protein